MRTLLLNIRNRTKLHLENIQFYSRNISGRTTDGNMEVGKNPRTANNGKRIGAVALTYVHRFITIVGRLIFKFVFGEKGQAMPAINDLTLTESATSLAAKIRSQKVSNNAPVLSAIHKQHHLIKSPPQIKSVDVVQAFIDRIAEINPTFNCVVDNCFEVALKDAAEADAFIQSGKMSVEEMAEKKPFLGVPVSTKDCIRVKGLLHTAGIWARRNIRGEKDSEAMALMRAAGAIPFALTNVSECCMW